MNKSNKNVLFSWLSAPFLYIFKGLKNPKSRRYVIRDLLLALFVAFLFFLGLILLWSITLKTPSLASFDDRLLGQSAKIYDRSGQILLFDLSQRVRRTVVPFAEISPYVKNATLAIEDIDFYSHGGIKISSIFRAVIANIFSLKFSQGGSTITQQVVKNSLLSQNKDISRKIKEWILAIKLEKTTDKDTIFNMYLNEAPYGGSIYGVEEASRNFFDKKSSELTLAESAYLASLPQSPSSLSPYGKNRNKLEDRKNLVLKKMLEYKMITQEEYDSAMKEKVVFQPKSIAGIKAPHFVMYVKDYLEEKYGGDLLEKGGLKITTTLNYDFQAKAEDVVKNYVTKNGPNFKAGNASLVVTDPRTGEILTMVGSKDYFDTANEGNFNVATAKRQPGSSFKPFVYATAFEKGYLPETPVYDTPTQFNPSCSPTDKTTTTDGCYAPQNYEDGYKGLLNFRQALAQSRNIPAVKVLYLAGVADSIKTATALGISSLGDANQYGLTLALGGGEVSLLEMTSSYGTFANGGIKKPIVSVLKIEDSNGKIIEEVDEEKLKTDGKETISSQAVLLLNNVLSDAQARAPLFGSKYFGDRQVAFKTGTTNNSRDAWMLGYTPSIAVGSWMGNNNNKPMSQQASAKIVGPMWKEYMDWILQKVPVEFFEAPAPADENTKPFLKGAWQGPGAEIHNELYWVNKDNPTGEAPGSNSRDAQYSNWEYGVQSYLSSTQGTSLLNAAKLNASTTNQKELGLFRIIFPTANSSLDGNSRVSVDVANYDVNTASVEYYVNGTLIGKSTQSPFDFSFIPKSIKEVDLENELKAVAVDVMGNKKESVIMFSIKE